MADKTVRFAELLTTHINNEIKKRYLNEALTPNLLREIRDHIRGMIGNIVAKSSHKLSQEAINWLANQVFRQVRVNDEVTINELVVINEYKLADLPYHDIELLRNLFDETLFAEQLEEEYRRRSAS